MYLLNNLSSFIMKEKFLVVPNIFISNSFVFLFLLINKAQDSKLKFKHNKGKNIFNKILISKLLLNFSKLNVFCSNTNKKCFFNYIFLYYCCILRI